MLPGVGAWSLLRMGQPEKWVSRSFSASGPSGRRRAHVHAGTGRDPSRQALGLTQGPRTPIGTEGYCIRLPLTGRQLPLLLCSVLWFVLPCGAVCLPCLVCLCCALYVRVCPGIGAKPYHSSCRARLVLRGVSPSPAVSMYSRERGLVGVGGRLSSLALFCTPSLWPFVLGAAFYPGFASSSMPTACHQTDAFRESFVFESLGITTTLSAVCFVRPIFSIVCEQQRIELHHTTNFCG